MLRFASECLKLIVAPSFSRLEAFGEKTNKQKHFTLLLEARARVLLALKKLDSTNENLHSLPPMYLLPIRKGGPPTEILRPTTYSSNT